MNRIRFVYPTDGDMLTDAAGILAEEGALLVEAAVEAEDSVSVQGQTARQGADGLWRAQVRLTDRQTVIEAQSGGRTESVSVYRLPAAAGKYALSVDDNIWWLAELTQQPKASLFDHPYLAVYKRAHEKYGAKVRLNLFYQVEGRWIEKYGPFNLSMMTDQYKEEFRANSDWLHLAFHSLQEEPANPYRSASYEEVYRDCGAVHREIIRFAGEETLEHATTVHYGCCTSAGVSALKDQGVCMLMGFMELNGEGIPLVSYNLSTQRVLDTQRYGFWRDPADGMIYGKIDVVMNSHSPERIVEILERAHRDHPLRGFTEIMIHEQYFYGDYPWYEPDYEARIMAGCRWCHENGYTGAFAEEAIG